MEPKSISCSLNLTVNTDLHRWQLGRDFFLRTTPFFRMETHEHDLKLNRLDLLRSFGITSEI